MSRDTQHDGDVVTFMYVPGRTGNIRRYNVRRSSIRKVTGAGVALAVAFLALSVDYVIARRGVAELDRLRDETRVQRDELTAYGEKMEAIASRLYEVDSFERKLRVITNLDPSDPVPLPGIGGVDGELIGEDLALLSPGRRHSKMIDGLKKLADAAESQGESLGALIGHLEDQTARLVATPSIAPTKGWVTSAFGYRTSPFTGNREFHKGIDIAGRHGTPIVAPADGKVLWAKHKRALGKAIKLRHGYGTETIYGHLADILVESGQKVKRGDRIALMGTTGRSTGPHLHYQVEVNDKPVNPRNYILD